jgi:hypothetical protein
VKPHAPFLTFSAGPNDDLQGLRSEVLPPERSTTSGTHNQSNAMKRMADEPAGPISSKEAEEGGAKAAALHPAVPSISVSGGMVF